MAGSRTTGETGLIPRESGAARDVGRCYLIIAWAIIRDAPCKAVALMKPASLLQWLCISDIFVVLFYVVLYLSWDKWAFYFITLSVYRIYCSRNMVGYLKCWRDWIIATGIDTNVLNIFKWRTGIMIIIVLYLFRLSSMFVYQTLQYNYQLFSL